ncbi:hypothetical protein [Microbacterium sp. 2FI]|uniref:hypothetical protein n=1 Tax=Microbacterium sp. 2FI TaxID=2502193 RepID=UPI0010F4761B|nr:hypothetical protein [Microbacterium sp. 2FI]
MSNRLPSTLARAMACVAVLVGVALTASCAPEPDPAATASGTPSASPTASPASSPSPTPIATDLPDAGFELPPACESIYSAAMFDQLETENAPLNDPGVTMLSTQNVDLIEILESGAPTIRCSWGMPSEYGLATNVTVVDAAQAEAVRAALASAGVGCEQLAGGTVCAFEQRGITQDDEEYASGETHYLQDGGWVSTAWINFHPEGYTEDIAATLWG